MVIEISFNTLSHLNYKLFDSLSQVSRNYKDQRPENSVVIIGLDQAYMSQRTEPYSLMHADLSEVLKRLVVAKPKAVLTDIVLPENDWSSITRRQEPDFNYANTLTKSLVAASKVMPLVFAKTWDISKNQYTPIFQDFQYAAELGLINQNSAFGSAIICTDEDLIIRHIPNQSNCLPDGGQLPILSEQLMKKLDIELTKHKLINFSVGESFYYHPLSNILSIPIEDSPKLKALFHNKIVLVGTVLPLEDRHNFPVAISWEQGQTYQPGLLVHAQIIRNVLAKSLISEPSKPLSILIALLGLIFILGSNLNHKLISLATLFLITGFATFYAFQNYFFIPIAGFWIISVVSLFSKSALDYIQSNRERNYLKKTFGGYASPDVMKAILDGQIKPETRGKKIYATVLFSDIRGFTTLSEKMEPKLLLSLLNEYLGLMTDVVHKHQGTLLSYLGDGIMAAIGCPIEIENSEEKAFLVAKEMLVELEKFNQKHPETPFKIGIGLHSGDILFGNVGSDSRFDFTIIGDVVNSSSRLESMTKELGYPVVLSKQTVDKLPQYMSELVDLGLVPLKGRGDMHVFGYKP